MKLLLGGALAALLVLSSPLRASDDDKARYLTNGYGLLYKLCEQEKPLDMILMVKTTPKEDADFLHQVSAAAKQDVNMLDELQDHDKSLTFDHRGLPQFEEDTRDSIRGDKQHMLLFGDTGSAFVRAILITQIEAGTYGMNLAKVLADAEPDAHRAAVVRKIGNRWEKLRNRAYALLNAT
jgi:hypothetical protein